VSCNETHSKKKEDLYLGSADLHSFKNADLGNKKRSELLPTREKRGGRDRLGGKRNTSWQKRRGKKEQGTF